MDNWDGLVIATATNILTKTRAVSDVKSIKRFTGRGKLKSFASNTVSPVPASAGIQDANVFRSTMPLLFAYRFLKQLLAGKFFPKQRFFAFVQMGLGEILSDTGVLTGLPKK